MGKYKIWNKTDDIYTQRRNNEDGKAHWTAREYIDTYAPWADIPGAEVVVGGGLINGTVFMEYGAMVEIYKNMGVEITDEMTPEQVLTAIEYFEDNPPQVDVVSPEERIAAALEFGNLLNM